MTKNIFNYLVVSGTQTWFFETFKDATYFINKCDQTTYPRIYKLVYANGELVKDGKR